MRLFWNHCNLLKCLSSRLILKNGRVTVSNFLLVILLELFISLMLFDLCSLLNRVHHIKLNNISFICSILNVFNNVFFLHIRGCCSDIILIRVKTLELNLNILLILVFFEVYFLLRLHKLFLLTFMVFAHGFHILFQLCFFNLQTRNEVLKHGSLKFQLFVAIEQDTYFGSI